MDDRTLLEKLNMLAAAHASGPDDDGYIIAQAVNEIERLRRSLVATQEAAELGDIDACHELARKTLAEAR